METTDLAAVGEGWGVNEMEGCGETFRRTFGTEEESGIFILKTFEIYLPKYQKSRYILSFCSVSYS